MPFFCFAGFKLVLFHNCVYGDFKRLFLESGFLPCYCCTVLGRQGVFNDKERK